MSASRAVASVDASNAGVRIQSAATKQHAPVVVIGAGLAGVSTAYALVSQDVPVVIVDAGRSIANGSSQSNAGMLTAAMSDPWNTPGLIWQLARSMMSRNAPLKINILAALASLGWGFSFLSHANKRHYLSAAALNYRLAQYSLRRTEEIRGALSLSYDAATDGSMKIFRDTASFQRASAIARVLEPEGLQFAPVSRERAVEREPLLRESASTIVGGLFFPRDEMGDAFKYATEMAKRLTAAGAQIQLNTIVRRIVTRGGTVIGVDTSTGHIAAQGVVIAAGYQSSRFVRPFGLSLPLAPVKGYSLTMACDPAFLPSVPVIDDDLHTVVARLGSRLRVAGIAEVSGANTAIRPTRVKELVSSLAALYPTVARNVDVNSADKWAGLRPMSADGLPYIGDTPVKGLYVNTGHGHLGWTMAAGSGQLVADQMLGRATAIDIKPYSLARL